MIILESVIDASHWQIVRMLFWAVVIFVIIYSVLKARNRNR